MREFVVEDEVCKFATGRGWLVRKMKWIGRRNAMDRFFAKNGRIIIIEFKRPGKEPRIGQEREIARMRAAGVECHVIDNIEDGCALFA